MMKPLLLVAAALLVACGGLPGSPDAEMCLVGWEDRPEQVEVILDAAQEWRDRTHGDVALTFESGHCNDGSVPIYASRELLQDSLPACGVTDGDGLFIELNVDCDDFYQVSLHELGHFLTGPDHSSNPNDIMSLQAGPVGGHLTDADVARFY